MKPGSDARYSASELSELDAMTVLKSIRAKYAIDKVFLFFSTVSKRTTVGPIAPDMIAMPAGRSR